MPDIVKNIPITLDKVRNLRLDLNAMVLFEEATGKSVFKIGADMSARDIRALLWACLRHEDKNLTVEAVGQMVTPENIPDLSAQLIEAFNTAMPEPESETQGEALSR
ncbi:hypothetical protein [Dehalococcoides mccartyi]|uniref:Tail assembly chaperone n=1 Tax=Dehalococcoides mccartyi TaxID=61435 RepID=A0A142VAJ4_9CHLR|nr:hypothetical protein [Dehalococcoides mccartyi]AMU86679.1 hypothetical protein Dm11a5_0853 [Dehalococcoides mccartyi]